MILCNGSPKTGTHLLLKSVRLFGGRCVLAVHRHDTGVNSTEHQHLHITRCPRNSFISYLRMQKIEPSHLNIVKEMKRLISEYSGYLHYLDDKNTLNVKFELLLSDPLELNRIALFLDKPLSENHFDRLKGGTATYNEVPSDHSEFWVDSVSSKWVEFGGDLLEKKLGYTYE